LALAVLAACEARVVPLKDAGSPIPREEPTIRVLLRHVEGDALIGTKGGGLRVVGVSDVDGESVRITRVEGTWRMDGRELPAGTRRRAMLTIRADGPLFVSSRKGRTYPGEIRCVADPGRASRFAIINVVTMGDYIPGVLAGELYEGWSDAAFQAQAVAARSYALSEMHQRRDHDWDVTDTPATQAYHGVAFDQAVRCAGDTAGEILSWQGSLVPGYFSSCCGGAAATARDAVGPNPVNAVPPLDGHGDPARCTKAPRYRWSERWDPSIVAKALQAWGRREGDDALARIGDIVSMDPVNINDHGRPTHIEAVDRTGHRGSIRCVDLPIVLARSGMTAPPSGWIKAALDGTHLEVEGHGFGHGVGLCQYGAESMGSTGAAKGTILGFYYPGATITKAW